MFSGLIVWFLPTDSSLTPQQMVGVGLGSVAFVTILAFLSFSAVWYVRLSLLKNEWNGGEAGVGVMQNSWAWGESGHRWQVASVTNSGRRQDALLTRGSRESDDGPGHSSRQADLGSFTAGTLWTRVGAAHRDGGIQWRNRQVCNVYAFFFAPLHLDGWWAPHGETALMTNSWSYSFSGAWTVWLPSRALVWTWNFLHPSMASFLNSRWHHLCGIFQKEETWELFMCFLFSGSECVGELDTHAQCNTDHRPHPRESAPVDTGCGASGSSFR